jgi:Fic family protein
MRIPESPPPWNQLYEEASAAGRLPELWQLVTGPTYRGQYLHWDKLTRHDPPEGLTHREWWLALKLHRLGARTRVPLTAVDGGVFSFLLPDPAPERLHQIDLSAGGSIEMPDQVTSPETRDRYIVNSLIEEAITSSQLEGAVTTREIAKEMIRTNRKPRDTSEQMILNNYHTMRFIRTLIDKPLQPALVCDIQRRITASTLDDPSAAGRLRREADRIDIADEYGEIFHTPPPANELEHRIKALCDFANSETPTTFVHPVVRSILLHFWLAYDHPFKDGNGRTARALFYWSMLRNGYWLCEFISISHIIRSAPVKYYRAFLYTETDDDDLTYFLLHHLEIIRKAVDQLHSYIRKKISELRALERELRGIQYLNHRQRTLINHALRHPDTQYTIESHRGSHNVVYETARTDLHDLANRGLLDARRSGRTWIFRPARNLERRLRKLRA